VIGTARKACSSPPSPARTASAGPAPCCNRSAARPTRCWFWLGHFDRFALSQPDTYGLAATLAPLVASVDPDIVHFHHLLLFGAETVDLVRRAAAARAAGLHRARLLPDLPAGGASSSPRTGACAAAPRPTPASAASPAAPPTTS
jgi:hypothetical protein